MDKFFHKINLDDFETLTLTVVNSKGRMIGTGTYPVDAVMTYGTTLDIEYKGTSFLIDCSDMAYDDETKTYTVSDEGIVFHIML